LSARRGGDRIDRPCIIKLIEHTFDYSAIPDTTARSHRVGMRCGEH
jgi:hypothetical protein